MQHSLCCHGNGFRRSTAERSATTGVWRGLDNRGRRKKKWKRPQLRLLRVSVRVLSLAPARFVTMAIVLSLVNNLGGREAVTLSSEMKDVADPFMSTWKTIFTRTNVHVHL